MIETILSFIFDHPMSVWYAFLAIGFTAAIVKAFVQARSNEDETDEENEYEEKLVVIVRK